MAAALRIPALTTLKAVLLDVDGTLIDSNGAHAESWTEALNQHGVAVDLGRIRPLIGMGGDKLLPAVAGVEETSTRGKAITRTKKELFNRFLPALQPTRGARAFVEYLRSRQIDVVIATSADEREMTALLKRAGVDDLIPKRTTKDDAGESKPDPDIVHAALERSSAGSNHALMVGDTPYDIEAAARAGVATVALRSGGYWRDDHLRNAAGIFDDPAALLDFWRPSRQPLAAT